MKKEMNNVFMTKQLQSYNVEVGNILELDDLPTLGEKSSSILQLAFQELNGWNLQICRKHRYMG